MLQYHIYYAVYTTYIMLQYYIYYAAILHILCSNTTYIILQYHIYYAVYTTYIMLYILHMLCCNTTYIMLYINISCVLMVQWFASLLSKQLTQAQFLAIEGCLCKSLWIKASVEFLTFFVALMIYHLHTKFIIST